MKTSRLLLLGLFASLALRLAAVTNYYVDPVSGSDTAAGSLAAPFKTIGRAKTAVAAINAAMSDDIIVNLRGGYYLYDGTTGPLTFGSADGGFNGRRVIYKNYDSSAPIISGLVDLTNGNWSSTTVNGATVYKKTGVNWTFRQLYVNTNYVTLARYPNASASPVTSRYLYAADVGVDPVTKRKLQIQKSDWDPVATLLGSNTKAELVFFRHWTQENIPLDLTSSTVTTSGSIASIAVPDNINGSPTAMACYVFNKDDSYYSKMGYYFTNNLTLIDVAGEWFLDVPNTTLYYRPKSGESLSGANFNVAVKAPSTLTSVVVIDGANNLTFQGVQFEGGNWIKPTSEGMSATQAVQPYEYASTERSSTDTDYPQGLVKVISGHNLRFYKDVFRRTGANGLQFFTDVDDADIRQNSFYDIAGNAIEIGANKVKSPGATEQCSNITIWNNTFRDFGRDYSNGDGILAHFADDLVIDHNEIWNGSYSGLQVGNQTGGGDDGMGYNLIRYNFVHDVMGIHDDGGGIYTLGKQNYSYIIENYIKDLQRSGVTSATGSTTGGSAFPCARLYLDNYSQAFTVTDNVVENCTDVTKLQINIGVTGNTFSPIIDTCLDDAHGLGNMGVLPSTDTKVATVIANAGVPKDGSGNPTYLEIEPHPRRIAFASRSDALGTWTPLSAIDDNLSAPGTVEVPAAVCSTNEGAIKVTFTSGPVRQFRFRAETTGTKRAQQWKVRYYDTASAAWKDVFAYKDYTSSDWATVFVTDCNPLTIQNVDQLQLYVKTASGEQAAVLEFVVMK